MQNQLSNFILIISSYIISVAILFSIPFRSKSIKSKTGKLIEKLSEKNNVIQYVIIVSGFVLISILFIRDFGFLYNAVVCLVGILGIFMSSQEIVLYKKSGIYEKGIIANAKFLTFSEIYSVPVLNLDESEQQKNSGTELKVIRKKGAALNFVFDSPEEKNKVLAVLKSKIKKENIRSFTIAILKNLRMNDGNLTLMTPDIW